MNKLKLGLVVLLGQITLDGFAQNNFNNTISADSLGTKTSLNIQKTVYILNNGMDTLYLDPIYHSNLFMASGFFYNEIDLEQAAIDTTSATYDISYSPNCAEEEIKLIDSLDLNGDGFKEVILYREWHCYILNPVPQPYGVGDHQQSYSNYEVWDVQHKKRLFKVTNMANGQVAVSTNVISSYGYRFDVEIDKKGTFHLFVSSEDDGKPEIHEYDKHTGTYKHVSR